mmetsp:Transcript_64931/g.130561  ORF Transcript_64931/g.130561 Transcript_64931/m.130561 type:complete len:204 (+) Transcript_64931:602-1213(+)
MGAPFGRRKNGYSDTGTRHERRYFMRFSIEKIEKIWNFSVLFCTVVEGRIMRVCLGWGGLRRRREDWDVHAVRREMEPFALEVAVSSHEERQAVAMRQECLAPRLDELEGFLSDLHRLTIHSCRVLAGNPRDGTHELLRGDLGVKQGVAVHDQRLRERERIHDHPGVVVLDPLAQIPNHLAEDHRIARGIHLINQEHVSTPVN